MPSAIRALCALLLLASCGGEAPPHIVLVTADTLRADHLSGAGYPRATSPRLDAFAAGAWSFEQAITVIPKTAPAFATLFTGRHPREHGVRSNFARVPEALPLLAERLAEAGYRTAAFVSNPALRESRGFARGFDLYRVLPEERGVAEVNEAFLAFARESWDAPTFVWLHYIDPHGPYAPPPAYEALFLDDALAKDPRRVPGGGAADTNKVLGAIPRYQQRADGETRAAAYVARYDAEIRYVDDAFGAVVDALRSRRLFEPSAVVFTSDHGESLGEHDYWFEHGWFAYEPGLRVPLFVKAPHQQAGRRVAAPVSHLDLHATLLALAGLSPDTADAGVDLLSAEPSPDPILVENADRYPEKLLGARSDGWKYLRRERDGREELYDLNADPGETRDLAAEEPGVRDALARFVSRRLETLRERAVPPAPPLPEDAETRERLRDLGYVE